MTRLLALLVAVVLGVGSGVTTAVVTGDGEPAAYADPLGIRAPLVNLPDCTGGAVLVVANGDTAPPLRSALANLSRTERKAVRYLDTRRSCTAKWTSEGSTEIPRYVAYLGPGDPQDLCTDRMTAAHRGDNVTFLKADSDSRAECLCEVAIGDAPVLSQDMKTNAATVIWVKALQSILVTIDESRARPAPTALTADDVTGQYDARTIARVNSLHVGADRPPTGVADGDVWLQLINTGCSLYDYS